MEPSNHGMSMNWTFKVPVANLAVLLKTLPPPLPRKAKRTIDELIGDEDDIRLTPLQMMVRKLSAENRLDELDELTKRLIISGDYK